MREILFRGKNKTTNNWVYGFVMNSTNTFLGQYINGHKFNFIEIIPETVGQFTGLTDKNGKKIFEGDILQSIENPKIKEEVSFDDGAFGFYCNRTNIVIAFSDCEHGENADEYEVIGNRWDNPELLGE